MASSSWICCSSLARGSSKGRTCRGCPRAPDDGAGCGAAVLPGLLASLPTATAEAVSDMFTIRHPCYGRGPPFSVVSLSTPGDRVPVALTKWPRSPQPKPHTLDTGTGNIKFAPRGKRPTHQGILSDPYWYEHQPIARSIPSHNL